MQAAGIQAMSVPCDVRRKLDVEKVMTQAVKRFGGLDILFANAGIFRASDFLDVSEEQFDEVCNINLKGVFLVWHSNCASDSARSFM